MRWCSHVCRFAVADKSPKWRASALLRCRSQSTLVRAASWYIWWQYSRESTSTSRYERNQILPNRQVFLFRKCRQTYSIVFVRKFSKKTGSLRPKISHLDFQISILLSSVTVTFLWSILHFHVWHACSKWRLWKWLIEKVLFVRWKWEKSEVELTSLGRSHGESMAGTLPWRDRRRQFSSYLGSLLLCLELEEACSC